MQLSAVRAIVIIGHTRAGVAIEYCSVGCIEPTLQLYTLSILHNRTQNAEHCGRALDLAALCFSRLH